MQVEWEKVRDYSDIIFEEANGMGKITINRPEVHNAFRPETLTELIDAFNLCRENPQIGVVILTGAGDKAFCSGGDQRVRGHGGYVGSDGVVEQKRVLRHNADLTAQGTQAKVADVYSVNEHSAGGYVIGSQ